MTWWNGWPRLVALGVAGLIGLAVALGSVQGLRLLLALDERQQRACPTCAPDEEGWRGPRNVLVLGSDTRKGLSEEEQVTFGGPQDVEGRRSDTIILVHIDPDQEDAVAVHFPRDLRVDIPGHGPDKINAAFQLGGPDLAVRTVQRFTGLPIHHFVVVDLAAFQSLVDSIGGVRICVDRPMFDELAGLAIPTAGCHTLDGQEALAFVRARHVEGDLIPDFSRISRQQQFMRSMLNRLLSAPGLLNAGRIGEAASTVTTDDRVSGADFIFLATKLRSLAAADPTGAQSLDLRVIPSLPRTIDEVSYVVAEQPETRTLFRRLAAGRPLGDLGQVLVQTPVSPAQVSVVVLQAGALADARHAEGLLRRAGFRVLGRVQASGAGGRTQILHVAEAVDRAQVVLGYFPGLPLRQVAPELLGAAEVGVLVGDDYGAAVTPGGGA